MAKIPTFQSTSRVSAMPGLRQDSRMATPDVFGARQGEALSRFGQELNQIGGEIRAREDKVAVKEAYSKASDELRAYLHDPQTGAYAQVGGNARGVAQKAESDLERIKSNAARNLSPSQRTLFDQFWEQSRESALIGTARHEADQMKAHEEKMDAAILAGAEDDMVSHFQDPEALKKSRELADATIRSRGAQNGWSNDQLENELRASRSRSYGAVVARMMVAGDIEGASKFLEQHKERMDSRSVTGLEQDLGNKKIQLFAEQTANTLAPFGTSADREGEVLADLNKKYQAGEMTITQYQESSKVLQARFADFRRIEQQDLAAKTEEISGQIFAAQSVSEGRRMVDGITDLKVRRYAEQAYKIRFQEELAEQAQARAESRMFARQEAAENRRESKMETKALEFQQKYESLLPFAAGDPKKMVDLIRKQYSGFEEENLVRYAESRMQEERVKPTAVDLKTQLLREGAKQHAVDILRARIDESLKKGQGVSTEKILSWASSPEFQTQSGDPVIDKRAFDEVSDYAAKRGVFGEVNQSRVESVLKNLDTKGQKWGLEKFPGLYDMVLQRIPPGSKPTDQALSEIVSRLVVQKGSLPGVLWGRNTTTAYQALVAGRGGEFNVTLSPQDQVFFSTFLKSLPSMVPDYSGLKVTDEMIQEFGDQVTAPDIAAGSPWALPESSNVDRKDLYRFYGWLKTNYPDTLTTEKAKDPKHIMQMFNIFRGARANAGK